MNIVLIIAGNSTASNSSYLGETCVNAIREHIQGVHIDTFYLKNMTIDHFTLEHYKPDYPHETDFVAIQNAIQAADGLIIASPIWSTGVPAHLKNLIDRMGSFALDATHSKGTLGGKPFFLIYTGAAPTIVWKSFLRTTTSSITAALRYFGATPVGSYFEGRCIHVQGENTTNVEGRPQTLAAVHAKGIEFANIVDRYKKTGALPIGQNTWGKVLKFGESIMKKVF